MKNGFHFLLLRFTRTVLKTCDHKQPISKLGVHMKSVKIEAAALKDLCAPKMI